MLKRLSIQNIVLIEQAELAFEKGLCVLTGETGAGKSILLDALCLPLGLRAEARLVRNGAQQGSVTAEFDIADSDTTRDVLQQLGLETEDDTLILRRNLSTDGKTRCFVNDQPVSVGALKQIGDTLLEIHGQHDQRGLLNTATHRDTLDEYGGLAKPAAETAKAHEQWSQAVKALAAFHESVARARAEQEYLAFMKKELGQLSPRVGEEQELSDARTSMMQGEKLAEIIKDALAELNPPKAVRTSIGAAERIMSRTSLNADNKFAAITEALQRAMEQVDEAESALEKLARDCAYNPQKLEQAEERLFALRAAARKHNTTVDELPALLAQTEEKLSGIEHAGVQEKSLTAAVDASKQTYMQKAQALSELRRKHAKKLEKAVMEELASLKMAGTGFAIALEPLYEANWSAGGMESVRFEAATNKGSAFAPLHKIASGGELSRFMLALKVVLADVKSTPSLIFDEIDTGTGGAVADAIGQRLAALGKDYQVFVVTHLPQVAAKGENHIRITKQERKGHTFTRAEMLAPGERTEELARMLAGAEVTREARQAAERLMQVAG